MATVVKSLAVEGIEGFSVEVEAVTLRGQKQALTIIGLGDQAVREAGERIEGAMENCGYDIPKDKVIISLAPGNRRKRGSHYDLAMTIALLQQTDQIAAKNLDKYAIVGELSLNGRIRSCNGILPMMTEARRLGISDIILPFQNQKEAEAIGGLRIHGMKTLGDVIRFLEGREVHYEEEPTPPPKDPSSKGLDFSDVKGQRELVDAIVLAAAGGHNLLMIGSPGCGKTMIAQRIPTILPPMTEAEAMEVTKIHSIAGLLQERTSIVTERPFRAPHHNISLNALIGGGAYANPGEVSLAHNGVLFLDELAEFSRSTLDALRQPLENRQVTISRVNGTNTYPASFMLVAAANPCPCGYYPESRCRCTNYEILHYRGKISGPIMDRIDLQKDVKPVSFFDLESEISAPSSAELRDKVCAAREIQNARFHDSEQVHCNAQMTTGMIQKFCKLNETCKLLLKEKSERNGYSARVIHKILRMARTAADISNSTDLREEDIVTALGCRDLDRSSNTLYAIK